jgi:hypothetical protein
MPETIMEHDRGNRRSTDVMVRFFTRPDTVGMGRVINVSATGAFMETQFLLPLLSLLYLRPIDLLPADNISGRIAATVVRCTATGVGLEWYEFAAEATSVYACLATGSNDLVDAHQLTLPTMPDAQPLLRRVSGALELRDLCRLELRD